MNARTIKKQAQAARNIMNICTKAALGGSAPGEPILRSTGIAQYIPNISKGAEITKGTISASFRIFSCNSTTGSILSNSYTLSLLHMGNPGFEFSILNLQCRSGNLLELVFTMHVSILISSSDSLISG